MFHDKAWERAIKEREPSGWRLESDNSKKIPSANHSVVVIVLSVKLLFDDEL